MTHLSSLSISQIVAIYNSVATKPVKTFRDKTTAIARVETLLEDQHMYYDGETVRPIPFAEPPMDVVCDGESEADYEEASLNGTMGADVEPVAEVEPVAAKPARQGRSTYHGDNVILVCVPENPKRAGSATHARFALYRSGMLVSEYIAAAKALHPDLPSTRFHADLAWDVKHGFISIA